MSNAAAVDVLQNAMLTATTLAAPLIVILLALTLAINVLQTLTQLHDQTLLFVPRLVGALAALMLLLPWLLGRLGDYTTDVYRAAGRP